MPELAQDRPAGNGSNDSLRRERPQRFCSVLVMALAMVGCASLHETADTSYNAEQPSASCERGNIERRASVMVGPDGLFLTHREPEHALPSIYESPDDNQVEAAMLAAAEGALDAYVTPGLLQSAGASYMVRLECGGLIYVFEKERDGYPVGSSVLVELGLVPRLVRR